MKIKIHRKLLYIYLLALIGFLLLVYYIWFRFIRQRVMRDIPFDLTLFSFISICIICFIYIYVLYRLYVPAKTPNILVYIIYPYIQIILKPFYFFDRIIRTSHFFKETFIKLSFKVIVTFKMYITKHNEYLFIFFNIIPKLCLLLSFILDIFYFNTLYYFYLALCLSLLTLFYNYTIHLLTQYLNNISNYLDKYYTVVILSTEEEENEYYEKHNTMCFAVFLSSLKNKFYDDNGVMYSKDFIYYQSDNLIFEKQLYKYTCIETWFARNMYVKKYNINHPKLWVYEPESDEISKALIGKFKEVMPQAYYFKAFIDTHNELVKSRERYITFNKVIIIIYLICWLYILFVSLHTLNILELLDAIKTINSEISEPFSITTLSYIILIVFKTKKQCISPRVIKSSDCSIIDVWSQNPYRLPYYIDENLFKKISIIFVHKQLKILEKDFDNLTLKYYEENDKTKYYEDKKKSAIFFILTTRITNNEKNNT